MAKSSFAQKFKSFFSKTQIFDDAFFETLSDALIEGDIGAKTAWNLVETLQKKSSLYKTKEDVLNALKAELLNAIHSVDFIPEANKTNLFLVLGVNGVGKTTTIAKLASFYKTRVSSLVVAASDTFRAAAIDQLRIHGERLNVRVVAHQSGADPAAVIFDASESIRTHGGGLVLADTAGRLHNKENLVQELQKINRVAESKADNGCYKKILVLDATTGQNALRQAEVFHEAVGVDALVLTKYDSSAKGGALFSIGKELQLPVFRVCFGEQYTDIEAFNPEEYANEFLGYETNSNTN